MKLLAWAVVCCLGCGSKGGDPKSDPTNDKTSDPSSRDPKTGDSKSGDSKAAGNKILDGYELLKDQLCACMTKECAEPVKAMASDWLLEVDHVSTSVDPDHAARWMRLEKALQACAAKLGVGSGSP